MLLAPAMPFVLKGSRFSFSFAERVPTLESSTRMQQMTLHGLEKYQNYSVQVVASTRVGSGLKSRSIYCTTKEDGERERPLT